MRRFVRSRWPDSCVHDGPISAIKSDKDWRALLSYLPEGYERLAHEHRVLNTQWPNAKVTDAQTLLRFILLHVGADLPLRQTVAVIANAGGPNMAPVWLHKRMRAAQPYLASVCLPRGMAVCSLVEAPARCGLRLTV